MTYGACMKRFCGEQVTTSGLLLDRGRLIIQSLSACQSAGNRKLPLSPRFQSGVTGINMAGHRPLMTD